jgi:ribonuclease G
MSDESRKEEILINVTPSEVRAALLENGVLQEVFIERAARRGLISNIYNGTVSRVLPGMQAAFIDIGLDRTAFLHVSDIARNGDQDDTLAEDLPEIRDLIREGDQLLVQVVKDPLGNKGARLTTFITLPSRHLVLLPRSASVGISARIEQEEERERLRAMVEELLLEQGLECGAIVRTVAEGTGREPLVADLKYLTKLWDVIQARCRNGDVKHLVNEDLSLPLRVLRDLATSDVETVLVDSKEDFAAMHAFAETFLPGVESRLELRSARDRGRDSQGAGPEHPAEIRRLRDIRSD